MLHKLTGDQPCDLNGFMDYLYYVERRAEHLQFFLWFCDYVERWSRLPLHQRQAAPAWEPAQDEAEAAAADTVSSSTPLVQPPQPAYSYSGTGGTGRQHMPHSHGPSSSSSHAWTMSTETVPYRPRSSSNAASITPSRPSPSHVSIHQRAGHQRNHDRLANILTLLEDLPETAEHAPRHALLSPREPPDWCLHYQQALLHEQPLRGEIDRIVAHYIAADGARALPDRDLSAPDRAACLRAAKHTTHPSALLPAFFAADAALRDQLFPAFVKSWCVGNIDPRSPRLVATQVASVLLLLLGAAVLVLLALYERSNAPRLVCLLLWWPALSLLVLSSWYRMDLLLYLGGQRLLRPWESDDDLDSDREKNAFCRRGHHHPEASTSSAASASSRVDPLRKASLQAFGPRNDPDSEAWTVRQTRVPLYRRLLSQLSPSGQRTATLQHEGARAMQKRAARTVVMSAGFVSAVVVLASLFIPVA